MACGVFRRKVTMTGVVQPRLARTSANVSANHPIASRDHSTSVPPVPIRWTGGPFQKLSSNIGWIAPSAEHSLNAASSVKSGPQISLWFKSLRIAESWASTTAFAESGPNSRVISIFVRAAGSTPSNQKIRCMEGNGS